MSLKRSFRSRRQSFFKGNRKLDFESCERRDLLAADLDFDITDGGATVGLGGEVSYNATVKNVGDSAAADAAVIVLVPSGTSLNTETSTDGWDCFGQVCMLDIGEVAADSETIVNLGLSVNEDLPAGQQDLFVRGYAISASPEFRLRNNSDYSVTPIERPYHDLTFDITDRGAKVEPGGEVTYYISFENRGSNDAIDASIKVELPEHTTFRQEGSSEGWECTEGVCSLKVGDVASDESGEATIAVSVAEDLPGGLSRLVIDGEIAASGSDSRPNNNDDISVTPLILPVHDLEIDITDNGARTGVGETIAYAVTYGNSGDSVATGTTIKVKIPEKASFNAEESSEGWSCEEGMCTLNVGEVAPDSKGESTLALTYGDDLSDTRYFRVPATIAADAGIDSNRRNNRDDSITPVRQDSHDLRLRITDNGASVPAGGGVLYEVGYRNRGDQTASGSVVTAILPPLTVYDPENSVGEWKCDGQVCLLEVGDIESGASGEAAIAVTVADEVPDDVSYLRIDASIAAAEGTEKNERDNSDPSFTPIDRPIHDLDIDITDQGATVEPGGVVVYAVSWDNRLDDPAENAFIEVALPADTSYIAEGSGEGWECEEGTCTLKVGHVEGNAEGFTTIAIQTTEDLSGEIRYLEIEATIAADGVDRRLRNNRDTSVTPVERAYHDLRFDITDNGARIEAGGTVSYEATWQNRGVHAATDSVVTARIPEGTTFVAEESSDGWECADGVCTLRAGDIEPGESGEAKITVALGEELPDDLRYLRIDAEVNAANRADRKPGNNDDSSYTPIDREYHELKIDFSDRGATVSPGGSNVYYAVYSNRGEFAAANTVITVEVPEHMAFDASTSTDGWECADDGVCSLAVGDLANGDGGEVAFGVIVAETIPEDLARFEIWSEIDADGADSRTSNNRDRSLTPIIREA